MNREIRSNQGYVIIEGCTVGNQEIVIGHHPEAPNPYVCWYCIYGDNYYQGCYCDTLEAAREELIGRYRAECRITKHYYVNVYGEIRPENAGLGKRSTCLDTGTAKHEEIMGSTNGKSTDYGRGGHMAYLNFITDTEEMNYSMDDIANIVFDYAENIFNEQELQKNHLKPLEIVTKINFIDGNATVFRTAGSEICIA